MRTHRSARVVLAAAAAATAVACASGERSSGATSAPHTAQHAIEGDEIAMELIAYRPAELTVAVGSKVTWRQMDAGVHTGTSGTVDQSASGSVQTKPDGMFASGDLAQRESFVFTFERAGDFAFFCEIHPATMRGVVTAR